jgi:hypothetical protein
MRAAWTLFVVLAALLVPVAASAQPGASAVDEGRARFSKGVVLFRAGDYRAALVEFDRAYAIAPSFRIQFNIGQSCAELQDYACAVKAFERFLADGGKQTPAAQRATASSELRRLQSLVANVRVVVNVSGAEVTVDDVRVGVSPLAVPVMVSAGRRRITASRPPLAPVSSVVDVAGGDTIALKLELAESPAAVVPPAPAPAPAPTPPAPGAPSRVPFWIGAGATTLLVAGTVTFGVLSVRAKSDLDATVGRFGVSNADIDHARSRVDGLAIVTDVFGGAALVAAGITTVLYFTSKDPSTRVGVGPRGVTVAHTF